MDLEDERAVTPADQRDELETATPKPPRSVRRTPTTSYRNSVRLRGAPRRDPTTR